MTTYTAHGVSLTEGQKRNLSTAANARRGITLRLTARQLAGSDQLMLTKTQLTRIRTAKTAGRGVDVKLSKTQTGRQGGFIGALAAGLAAPMIGKMFGFGHRWAGTGRGLQLPGTGRGLQLPGTRRGKGKKKGGFLWALPALLR